MIIFVEGADGSGKTTLVKELSKDYPVLTITRKAEHDNPTLLREMVDCTKNSIVICERGVISEYIYRTLDQNPCVYSLNDLMYITKRSRVVYCKTDTQFIDALERGEDIITDVLTGTRLATMYDVIIGMLEREGVKVMRYSWKEDHIDEVKDFIKEV